MNIRQAQPTTESLASLWPGIAADIARIQGELVAPPPARLRPRIPPRALAVLEEVASEYGVTVADLSSYKRAYRFTRAKHEACRRLWALRGRGRWPSGPHIAAWLGFGTSNTVYWTLRRLRAAS